MSYATQDAAASDAGLQIQVRQALYTGALFVVGEPRDSSGHPFRLTLARTVLSGDLSGVQLHSVCQAVVNDGVTTAGATDAAVLARVQSLWSALSGV